MKKIEAFGTITRWTPETREVVFKLSFLDEEVIERIQSSVKLKEVIKLIFSALRGKEKTYEQLKRVHAMFTGILINSEETPNQENIKVIKAYCQENFYPRRAVDRSCLTKVLRKHIRIEDEPIPLHEQTIEEIGITMQNIAEAWPEIFATDKWYDVIKEGE